MFRKLLFIVAAGAIFQYWGDIKQFINPPPDFSKDHDGRVILYATSWCGYCAKARELLKANNIDYYEYDIEKSEDGNRQYKALGGRGVPVLLIKGQVIKGYSREKILALIQ